MLGTHKLALTIGKTALALAVATTAVGAAAGEAHASLSSSSLGCAEGTETFYLGLPIVSRPVMVIYAFRVNGGAWKWTPWYYSANSSYYVYGTTGWSALPADSSQRIYDVGNSKLIEAWEYRYDPATRATGWTNLQSCRTTSYFSGGIVFN